MTEHKKFLLNKRLVIVGPSPSMLKKEDGELIDSYDIVCRIKKSFPVPDKLKKYMGKRTDILFSHLKIGGGYKQNNFKNHKPVIFNNNLKYIFFSFPLYKQFANFYNNFKKECPKIKVPIIYQKNKNNLFMLRKELDNFDPTTGLASIVDILDYDIKELYITGMTFQKDGFLDYYKTKKEDDHCVHRTRKIHNTNKEFEYFKKLMKNDKRIKVDNVLQKLIDKSN